MTESNKQRIVKYLVILYKGEQSELDCIDTLNRALKFTHYFSLTSVPIAINCAIAEVEAVIQELKTRNLIYAYHQEELTELKAMLI